MSSVTTIRPASRTLPRRLARPATLALAVALGLLSAGSANAATCTWNTSSGNWNALANWLNCVAGNGNPGGVPGGADTAVIGAGGAVTVSNAQAINTLGNAGIVSVLDGVSFSFDARSSAASFTGGGQLVMGGPGTRLYIEGSNGMSLGAGSTIRGVGQIGQAVSQSGTSTFTNAGTISADSNGQALILLSPSNSGSYANNALMEARNGGTLDVRSTMVQGGSGQLRAEAGSTVLLNGAVVSGGLVSTAGTGRIAASNNGGNVLSGVTLAGVVDMASTPSQLRIENGLSFSNGSIDVGASSALTSDNRFTATQSLTGTGSINLAGGALRMEGAGQTTTGAGVAIRGYGLVGQAVSQSGQYTWVNNGLVSADVSGQTLQIVRPGNGSVPVQNNGILEAINGGRLLLSADIDAATGSQMRAGTGSVIEMNGVRVTGTVNTTGSGSFRASNNFNNVLSGVTLNGAMDLASQASQLRVSEGLVLNGSIDVGGSTLFLDNRFTATQGISGTGSVHLAGGAVRMEGTGQTTTGAGTTIRGHGLVGQATVLSGAYTWVNDGLVSADVLGQTLQIVRPGNGSVPVQNNGILEAINGGRLLLSADIDAATGSQMRAGTGSVIEMNGVRVTGTVNTTGSGSFRASNNFNNVLSGVTLNGAMDLASQASQLRVSEGLVLNGSIDVGGSTLFIDNRFTPTQGISGTGTVGLAGGAVRMEGTGQTTFGAGTTLRGHGLVGQAVSQSGSQLLINDGTIRADVGGQTLSIQPIANGNQAIQNNGTMQAVGGGVLQLNTSVTGGAGSRFDVDAGSQIVMNGVTFAGVVNQTGNGAITASNSGNNRLAAASFTGRIEVGSGQLRVADGLAMNSGATINVGASGVLSFDNQSTAVQTVSGNGQIVMAGGAMRFEGGTSTTWDSGITVRGSGSIGQAVSTSANQTLFNNGTLVADGGALSIAPIANSGALQGTGTLRIDGGALTLGTGRTTNQGTLDMRATGTLALGNQNLVLSGDYTNVQAGSGNAFNRRAGVSGTGQIQAAGNVAQVISGAGVSGGSTANATLTIGNVRVGANTYSVNIGNSGSTGPTLRGAVQTNVNGANISDARLSGSGVTASNYNAGAPAGSGETRAITFTAASAGALAPLSGQVLNLRSNFENIADQKLNIVLGGGAAAYNAAVGSAATPVQLANQRVGGVGSAVLAISNTAAAGAFSEDLNAGIASFSGAATASGSVSGRLAGTGNTGSGAITVGVNTASAGAQSGVVTLSYQTAGAVNGVSNGLGTASAGSQAVTVNGNVYQVAGGQLVSAPLNFGTVQVGQAVSQNLVVRNTAAGAAGFVEDLNASFGAASGTGAGLISGSGSLSGITAGNNSGAGNGTMTVSVNTSAAGSVNGSIAVNYFSAGAVGGVSIGLGTLAVGSEAYGVQGTIQATGNVINQASPLVNNPSINLGAVRVGVAAPTGTVSVTNQATVAPQAALNASIAPATGPVSASGSFNLLNPGATDNGSLVVGLNTGTAGNFTGANAGTATIAFVSDAGNVGNCAPNCQLNLASQVVNVEGKVYTQAIGSASGTAINFGVVRVGDTVSASNITVSNSAAATALNDTLRAELSGVSGPFAGNGTSVAGIGAQGSAALAVGLNTATAGVFSQNGTVAFTSQNADMADVSAGTSAAVSLFAQVNNLANGDFDLASGTGTLSQTGTSYTLDLGTLVLGDSISSTLTLDNDVAGPADELSGSFDLTGADDFGYGGWSPLSMLVAGASSGNLNIQWLAGALGLFSDTVVFYGLGTNASDTTGLAQTRTLTIRANVVNGTTPPPTGVPEPGTLALLLAAAAAGLATRRRAGAAA